MSTFLAPDLRPAPPRPATPRPRGRATGFSLIEVLVATAVMAIMVVMLGAVFQQASSSWDSGFVRAEGGMAVRAVVGSLTRDLATAVDGRRYGMSSPISPEPGNTGNLTFWRLRDGARDGNDVEQVTYKGGSTVTRTSSIQGDSTLYKKSAPNSSASFEFYVGAEPDQSRNSAGRPYEKTFYDSNGSRQQSAFPGEVAWKAPYVKVRCTLTRSGTISGLTVRSWGRDGVASGDDIVIR